MGNKEKSTAQESPEASSYVLSINMDMMNNLDMLVQHINCYRENLKKLGIIVNFDLNRWNKIYIRNFKFDGT